MEEKSKFIAKAFVKIRSKKAREQVFEKIKKGRISLGGNKQTLDSDYILISENKYAIMQRHDIKSQSNKNIDCNHYANGDEELAIKLFLELAQMDLNKPETLYYSVPNNLWGIQGQQVGGFIVKHCDIPKLHITERHYIDKNNPIARHEELAEAVQQGKIKLT